MGSSNGVQSAETYRAFAAQALKRAAAATAQAEKLYFLEQAALFHRLAETHEVSNAAGDKSREQPLGLFP
jgi:hypothetical protein